MRGKAVAIIPARGGSKGIPGKNLKPFLGLPLIAHTIKAALSAELISNVIVSSDDSNILKVAASFGAETLERPSDISGDQASSETAVLHAHDYCETCRCTDTLVMLQCTSPLTTPEEIDRVIGERFRLSADSAFSVVPVHAFLWSISSDGTGKGINHNPLLPRQRRQDRPNEYRETGAIYAFDRSGFVEAKQRFFGRSVPVALPDAVEIDLDTMRDWVALEAYAKTLNCGVGFNL